MDIDRVLDRAELFDRLDSDLELLQELVQIFIEDYPRQIADIQTALHEQDAARLIAAAHSLKGSVGNFCAKEAYGTAKRLEACGNTSDFATAAGEFQTLVREIKQVETALSALAGEVA